MTAVFLAAMSAQLTTLKATAATMPGANATADALVTRSAKMEVKPSSSRPLKKSLASGIVM